MKKRFIELEGVHNFRDIGSVPTLCGGTVKEGKLYRSARLSQASENDQALIKDLNIKVVLDYRFYDEMLENPNVVIDNVSINVIPAFKVKAQHSKVEIEEFFKSGQLDQFEKGLLEEYKQLPFDNQSYQFLFNELKKCPPYSILHHCTVGRDRTGVATALMLKLLNVEDSIIKEDYILSNEALQDFFKDMNKDLNLSDQESGKFMEAFQIKDYYLDFVYDLILDKYPSFEEYYKEEFGIDESDIARIREYYIQY